MTDLYLENRAPILRYMAAAASGALVAAAAWLYWTSGQPALSLASVAPPPAAVVAPAVYGNPATTPTEAPLASIAFQALPKPERCLAQAIYFEARGESPEGQLAVAEVVLNRTRDPRYPDKICDVVFQNAGHRHQCQFSFACDGRSDRPRNMAAWAQAVALAKLATSGPVRDLTEKATHYHADYVSPNWAGKLTETVTIGRHHFYRTASVR